MDKYQTSNVQYLDAWLYTVQLAYWLLYAAADEIELCVKPWEKYLPEVKRAQKSDKRKSVAITRKAAKRLFSTFDMTPFKPQESKNGKGHKQDTVFTKRKYHPPTRKHKNQRN